MMIWEEFKNNPFSVLGASPLDSRAKLIARQAELALFDDDRVTQEALAKLLHPVRRLQAEIRWFPGTQNVAFEPVRMFFQSNGQGPIPQIDSTSVLAQFNVLRLAIGLNLPDNEQDCRTALYALAVLADALYPEQVTEDINKDRCQAGFTLLPSTTETETELRQLLRETAALSVSMIRKPDSLSLIHQLESEYQTRGSMFHNSYLIELAAEELRKSKL